MRGMALWPLLVLAACLEPYPKDDSWDADGDGWGKGQGDCPGDTGDPCDCDDEDPEVHPDAEEVCDGVDNDCNGVADDRDVDGDGLFDIRCVGGTDCEDGQALVPSEGLIEHCNGYDDDCSGTPDCAGRWHPDVAEDQDGDGWLDCSVFEGSGISTLSACERDPGCAVAADVLEGDCDDGDHNRYPGAEELCGDGYANDCALPRESPDRPCPALDGRKPLWSAAHATLRGTHPDDLAGTALATGSLWGGQSLVLVGSIVLLRDHGKGLDDNGRVDAILGPRLGEVPLATSGWSWLGMFNDEAGTALATADLDGDGWDEVLVGARHDLVNGHGDLGRTGGRVYAVQPGHLLGDAACRGSGPLAGRDPSGVLEPRLAASLVWSAEDQDRAGAALATGELDGDPSPEIVVGAPWADGDSGEVHRGAVYLLDHWAFLEPVAPLDTERRAVLWGEAKGDRAGASVASGGDVDGDGLDDLLVGAPGAGEEAGRAYLLLDPPVEVPGDHDLRSTAHRTWSGEEGETGSSDGDEAGTSVALTGRDLDVDGDGYADLVVGAPKARAQSGQVYLVYGGARELSFPPTGPLSGAHARITGVAGDLLGTAVAAVGDVDGDGFGDLLLGAPGHATAYLVAGGGHLAGDLGVLDDEVTRAYFQGEDPDGSLGGAVAGGRINADEYADLLMADPQDDEGRGAIYLMYGGAAE